MTVSDLEQRNAILRLWQTAHEATPDGDDDAWDAYYAQEQRLMVNDDATGVERCALTGVPLLVSDKIAMVLRSALPGKREEAA